MYKEDDAVNGDLAMGDLRSMREVESSPEITDTEPLNALAYLQSIYRDPPRADGQRLRAAIAALPFESPKLAVTAVLGQDEFAERLERALKRSGMAGRLIEAKAPPDQE